MANLKKYDPRLESLVVETRTIWDDPQVGELSDDDRHWLAEAVHAQPTDAVSIEYERAHTGFTRIIKITVADIERLYQQKISG